MNTSSYVTDSLELHLFFGRIMKEHAFFLRAGFTPVNGDFAKKAEVLRREFEKVLSQVVSLSNGRVSSRVLCSGEVVTEFTALAERQTEQFTGIPIDKMITRREEMLKGGCIDFQGEIPVARQVKQINRRVLMLLEELISLKEAILRQVLRCNMFTMNYPLLIEHILREAKLYRRYVMMLEQNGEISCEAMKDIECFWNQIMMEHAMFIRGLLDPTENELMQSANEFAMEYERLLAACHQAYDQTLNQASLEETKRLKEYKTAATKGLVECEIRSIILPLLADHVLREANHYIRLLSWENKK